MYLTFHSHGQYWLVPYGYDVVFPPDYDDMLQLAEKAAAKTKKFRYTVGNTAKTLYPSAGKMSLLLHHISLCLLMMVWSLDDRWFGWLGEIDRHQIQLHDWTTTGSQRPWPVFTTRRHSTSRSRLFPGSSSSDWRNFHVDQSNDLIVMRNGSHTSPSCLLTIEWATKAEYTFKPACQFLLITSNWLSGSLVVASPGKFICLSVVFSELLVLAENLSIS